MKQVGKVKNIDKQLVTVGCTTAQGCGSCSSKSFCTVNEREYTAVNKRGVELVPGDMVELWLPPGKTVFAGFVVMIVPLILFLLFFMLAGRLIPGAGEGVQAIGGLLGLAVGFGVAMVYKKVTGIWNMPEIIGRMGIDRKSSGRMDSTRMDSD